MKSRVIVDASPVVALIDKSDRFHHWTTEIWKTLAIHLFTCEAVISETCFLLQRTYGGQDGVIDLLKRVSKFNLA